MYKSKHLNDKEEKFRIGKNKKTLQFLSFPHAINTGTEEDRLLSDGTNCLIHNDPRIRREVSSVACVVISK